MYGGLLSECRRTMQAESTNAMTALTRDELSELDVEITDWYRKHTKVEADDEETAMKAYSRMAPNQVTKCVIEGFEVEWKTYTRFVVKRVE